MHLFTPARRCYFSSKRGKGILQVICCSLQLLYHKEGSDSAHPGVLSPARAGIYLHCCKLLRSPREASAAVAGSQDFDAGVSDGRADASWWGCSVAPRKAAGASPPMQVRSSAPTSALNPCLDSEGNALAPGLVAQTPP